MAHQKWLPLAACMALGSTLPLLAGCNSGDSRSQTTGTSQAITVEVNQSRDQYGKQAIQLQLTNTTDSPLTVSSARLTSALFDGDISWEPRENLILPPGQPKSLPARLPAPTCGASTGSSAEPLRATLNFAGPGKDPGDATMDASDPFGVLPRNAGELCLAADAAAVATIVLAPELEVAPDGRTAVVRLLITPAMAAGSPQIMTIEGIDGSTLLAEPPTDPWPRNVAVSSGDPAKELALRIRPARCDPHAVAEDKVGTLLPLRVQVEGRQGLVKVPAPDQLRGRIYDFVTAACVEG
ncbi:hypothetical protein [Paenarthrobacter nitroguajacolicus]|nr:hypothetical protein [Paenarthrobacter nitroguajacolicus]